MPSLPKRFQLDLTGLTPIIYETCKDSLRVYEVSSLILSEDKDIIFVAGTCTEKNLEGVELYQVP